MGHKFKVRIYYEDTDAAQVVFYANYFKYTERARTELIYEKLKLKHLDLKEKFDVIFVVKSLSSKYIAPAKFEDEIQIISTIKEVKNSSFKMQQIIQKETTVISEAVVLLVTVNKEGKPVRIPNLLKKLID